MKVASVEDANLSDAEFNCVTTFFVKCMFVSLISTSFLVK
jgi:hypothetical protein